MRRKLLLMALPLGIWVSILTAASNASDRGEQGTKPEPKEWLTDHVYKHVFSIDFLEMGVPKEEHKEQVLSILISIAETRGKTIPEKYLEWRTPASREGHRAQAVRIAIAMIGRIGDKKTLPLLKNMLGSDDFSGTAAAAYVKMLGKEGVTDVLPILRWGDVPSCSAVMDMIKKHPSKEGKKAIERLIGERSGFKAWEGLVKIARKTLAEMNAAEKKTKSANEKESK
jgi:hypothetical protein